MILVHCEMTKYPNKSQVHTFQNILEKKILKNFQNVKYSISEILSN